MAQTQHLRDAVDGAAPHSGAQMLPPHLVSRPAVPALPAGSSPGDVLLGANASIGKNVFAMNVLFRNALCSAGCSGLG